MKNARAASTEVKARLALAAAVNRARDLINDNADTVTSVYMEKIIRGLIKRKKNISIEVLNEKEMKTKKLGLHLAVNQGSTRDCSMR